MFILNIDFFIFATYVQLQRKCTDDVFMYNQKRLFCTHLYEDTLLFYGYYFENRILCYQNVHVFNQLHQVLSETTYFIWNLSLLKVH
jgi:hypothetical protein